MTGSQIPDGSRLDLSKGETKTIKLLVQPSEGSAMGSTSVNVHAHSTESTVSAMTTASFIVDPGYQPAWVEQDPSFSCAPEMHVISKSRLETMVMARIRSLFRHHLYCLKMDGHSD